MAVKIDRENMTKEKVFEVLEECWEYSVVDGDNEYLLDLNATLEYIRKNLN